MSTAERDRSGIDVRIEGVQKAFGTKPVLRGVDLHFPPGQISVVIGPSGCGKSTLLRILAGLERPDAGQVLGDDQALDQLTGAALAAFRQRMGMVFQHSALFDSLTVAENVAFSLTEHTRLPAARIREVVASKLALVGLAGTEDLYPAELSGGMQKRVAIARAIARDPDLVLYDEPTTGLDPIMSTVVEDLIVDVAHTTGATSVVVTHQLSTIMRTGRRVTMILDGRVAATGTPEELYDSADPAVRSFLRGVPPKGTAA